MTPRPNDALHDMNGEMRSKDHAKRAAEAQNVVDLVDDLLRQAIESGASDAHFEPTGRELHVKFRLDGVLSPIERLPAALAENVIARL